MSIGDVDTILYTIALIAVIAMCAVYIWAATTDQDDDIEIEEGEPE